MLSGLEDPAVQQLLGRVETQKLLSEFFSSSEPFKLDTQGIRYKEAGKILPKATVVTLMDRMADLADQLI